MTDQITAETPPAPTSQVLDEYDALCRTERKCRWCVSGILVTGLLCHVCGGTGRPPTPNQGTD